MKLIELGNHVYNKVDEERTRRTTREFADVKILDANGEILRPQDIEWDEENNCWFLRCEWDDVE